MIVPSPRTPATDRRAGFSLIEVVAVMLIIALVASLAVTTMPGTGRGRLKALTLETAALLRLGPFTLDRAAHRLCLREEELALTSTEFRLLEFFLTHPGRAYNREQLLEEVWGQQHYVSPRTVDVHVRRLRERIEEQPEDPRFLTTVRGFGYRFEAQT